MSEGKHTAHQLSPHFLLSISEQLGLAKGFNFRWEIEFCQDMICIKTCSKPNTILCICVTVLYCFRHSRTHSKTILSHFDRMGSIRRYWDILIDKGILIRKAIEKLISDITVKQPQLLNTRPC